MKIKNLILALSAFTLTIAPCAAHPSPDLASKVLCPQNRNTQKFDSPIKIFISGSPGDEKRFVDYAISQFNEICAGLPIQAELVNDEKSANVIIEINPVKGGIGNKIEYKYSSSGVISKVRAVQNYDPNWRLEDRIKKVSYLKCLLEYLGFVRYNEKITDISFWMTAKFTGDTRLLSMTPDDKELIRFFYEKVPPNSPSWKVRQLVTKEFGGKSAQKSKENDSWSSAFGKK